MTGGAVSVQELLAVFDQSPGFLAFLRGPDFVFEVANAAYYQLVGHREMIGKPLREALPEIPDQGFVELLEQVRTTGVPFIAKAIRVMLQREPGAPLSEAFVDLLYQPLRGEDGAIIGVVAQGHDVTEQRRLETEREAMVSALRLSEERYRGLFDSIDDGYCLMQMIVDDHGKTVDYRFLETNKAFEGHTGLIDAKGRTARELVPDLDASWFEIYGGVAETGVTRRFENNAPAMNGRWFDVFAVRVGDPAQRLVALVFKDVTARKKAESEREQLLVQAEDARRMAEEASRMRDDFLATVSHELRTPLNAMLGWVQMLRAGHVAPDKRERALETVERNARAQAQLIEDLLDVSRILAGKLRLEVAPVDLHGAVEAALETVRPAAEAKGVRLQPTLASGGLVVGDVHRLQQIAWNLLSNAVKFTPKGGRVQVLLELVDSSVELTVADTGQGIAPDFLPFVFDRFSQADGGSRRAHSGLGLGLSIVRQLVEMHGGTVRASSEGEGRGATFTVRLPMAVARRDRTPTPSPEPSVDVTRELAGVSLLVLDDEADTRDMLQALLESRGAHVDVVTTVDACLASLATKQPDVLVSDVGMPGEDGYTLLERLRRRPREQGGRVPAIALTAYTRTEDRTRALRAGFDSHVPKPVEPQELVAVILALTRKS